MMKKIYCKRPKLLASIGIAHLDLLPFNYLAISKYDALGVEIGNMRMLNGRMMNT